MIPFVFGKCYDLKVCIFQNSCVEMLTLKVTVLGGGTFGRRWGQEGIALTNGINALIREAGENVLPILSCEVIVRKRLPRRKWALTRHRIFLCHDLFFLASRSVRNKLLLFISLPSLWYFVITVPTDWNRNAPLWGQSEGKPALGLFQCLSFKLITPLQALGNRDQVLPCAFKADTWDNSNTVYAIVCNADLSGYKQGVFQMFQKEHKREPEYTEKKVIQLPIYRC